MPRETTYTSLRENLASVLDEVVDQQETVIVRRSGARDVALIPATELAGLYETAHLLRSPRNARRLLSAIWLVRVMRDRSKRGACYVTRRTIERDANRERRVRSVVYAVYESTLRSVFCSCGRFLGRLTRKHECLDLTKGA